MDGLTTYDFVGYIGRVAGSKGRRQCGDVVGVHKVVLLALALQEKSNINVYIEEIFISDAYSVEERKSSIVNTVEISFIYLYKSFSCCFHCRGKKPTNGKL